jgi:hypothetical protein
MPHGHNQHQQREARVRANRARNDSDTEHWQSPGRKRGAPPEGLVGSQRARRAPTGRTATMAERELAPASEGSEVAPTPRAVERERERHARERALGRIAAGTMARQKAQLRPGVERSALEEAGRAADAKVRGKPSAKTKPTARAKPTAAKRRPRRK